MFSCNACIFMTELASKGEIPKGAFLSGNAGTVLLISLCLCTFPLAVRLAVVAKEFGLLIFYVHPLIKRAKQGAVTAGQTLLTSRFVMIMEQK